MEWLLEHQSIKRMRIHSNASATRLTRITQDNQRMTPCSETWNTTKCCLGGIASECCSDWSHHQSAVSIPLVLAQETSTSAPAPSSTNALTPKNSSSQSQSSLSTETKAGIGVGVVVEAIVFFAAGLLCAIYLARRKLRRHISAKQDHKPDEALEWHAMIADRPQQAPQELSSGGQLVEAPGGYR